MNRMEEYKALMKEVNQPNAELDETLIRAYKRKRRRTRQMIVRPMVGLAACFAVFILLVNFSIPAADACAQIPILGKLAAAVTFSDSLRSAVENEYMQPMNLVRTQNGITAEIDYLIVDQKQVNVFYRFDSEKYKELDADPTIMDANGTRLDSCGYFTTGFGAKNGEFRCLTIDFREKEIPNCLKVKLKAYSDKTVINGTVNYLTEFEFLLEFEPELVAVGKVIPVNQTVMLDGQEITIVDIEVYPTNLQVNITENESNSAWIKNLQFYIETDEGKQFDAITNGATAFEFTASDASTMTAFRADSPYFYDAKDLSLVITGAKWLRKDMEHTYLNLVTGEHGAFPEGTTFASARKKDSEWIVTLRVEMEADGPLYSNFSHPCRDADGNAYEINETALRLGDCDENGKHISFYEILSLRDYPYDEVWLSPHFSNSWTAEKPIIITVK